MQSELPLPGFDDPPQLDLRYDLVLMDCEEIQQLRSVAPEEVTLPVIVRADTPAAAADLRLGAVAPDQRRGQPQQTRIVGRIPSGREPEVLHIRFIPDLPVADASAIVFGQSGNEVLPRAERLLAEIERDAPHRGRISDSLHVERIAEADIEPRLNASRQQGIDHMIEPLKRIDAPGLLTTVPAGLNPRVLRAGFEQPRRGTVEVEKFPVQTLQPDADPGVGDFPGTHPAKRTALCQRERRIVEYHICTPA